VDLNSELWNIPNDSIMPSLLLTYQHLPSYLKRCFGSGGRISEDVYHFSYIQKEYDIFKKFETFFDFKCLRSFLPIDSNWLESYLSCNVMDYMVPGTRRLRVLSISNYKNITVLPDSINQLVQLRYLNISCIKIKCLLDTICDLYY
jgi:hypothetical protein